MRTAALDVLFALVGATPDRPVSGDAVAARLRVAGLDLRPDRLLGALLSLEDTRHVHVDRTDGYSFSLTEAGAEAAYALGPGGPVELTIVMIDLVGFVEFTAAHGDDAGLRAALELAAIARDELGARSGRVVKCLGDGVLGSLPVSVDPTVPIAAVAKRCQRPDGSAWTLRAAARRGRPIAHADDLYGADVNLVARLCSIAEPGQLVLSGFGTPSVDHLHVRGVVDPVPVRRVALR